MNAAAFILGVVGAVAAFVVLIKWVCSNAVVSSRLTTESSKVFGVQPKKILVAPEAPPARDTPAFALFTHALHESYHEYMPDVTTAK